MRVSGITPPTFETLEYGRRFEQPERFIEGFVQDLKGSVKLSTTPRYDRRLASFGSAVLAEGREAIKLGRGALVRDSELFKTIFHEEIHLRLMRKARQGQRRPLGLVMHPDVAEEEDYAERVAARYLRAYERRFGQFKH